VDNIDCLDTHNEARVDEKEGQISLDGWMQHKMLID
jgi:hypothetical protein